MTDSVNIIGVRAKHHDHPGRTRRMGSPNGVDKVFSFNQDITAFTNATVGFPV